MKYQKQLFLIFLLLGLKLSATPPAIHVWEMQQFSFHAQKPYKNPYKEVEVWVDLSGPGFKKRVYGFWDGGDTFHVRLVATQPGTWSWRSGSDPSDAGINGKSGSFAAIDWTEKEKNENKTMHSLKFIFLSGKF